MEPMTEPTTRPLSGRRAQAARNDELILQAARAVFVSDPSAPISAVAKRAGVGISALYRRYGSKEELLRQLSGDGLRTYIAEAEAALAGDASKAMELNVRLLERTKAAGAIRADIDVNDLTFLFEQVASIRLGDEVRTSQLRHRYLALLLEALHTPLPGPLPGPPPTWEEIGSRWIRDGD